MPQKKLFREQLLQRFLNLKVSRQKELYDVVVLAAEVCQTQNALLALTDEDTPYFKLSAGIEDKYVEDYCFLCNQLADEDELIVIPDLHLHNAHHTDLSLPTVGGMRFFAGLPIISYDGQKYGNLCIFGNEPQQLKAQQLELLTILSQQILNILEFDTSLNILKSQFYEIQNSENIFRSFFESSQSGYVLIDANRMILAYNRSFAEMTRQFLGTEVRTGSEISPYIHKSLSRDFAKNFQAALSGKTIEHESLLEHDGQQTWLKVCYNPAHDGEGRIIGISYKSTDITERKLSQQRILRQNESLRKIAHFQSHELRKPVASILGLMNVIKMEGGGENGLNYEMMERAVVDLDNTIRNISGTIETQPEQKLA